MLKKIENYILKYNMLKKGDIVVVGVSGGADSCCLFDVLCKLKPKYSLTLKVVHVNHNIRGEEADNDEKFVRELCESRGVDFKAYSFDVEGYAKNNNLTVEEAGRKLRYEAFYETAGKNGIIAVAHNMNDNCETMLMRFFRGTGIKGLGGISPVRDKIIRPLLCVTRNEIENYCTENSLNFRIDYTNNITDYTRNKIRLNIIPELEKNFNGSMSETMFRTSEIISAENKYIEKAAQTAYEACLCGDNKINVSKLLSYDEVIRRRVVRCGFEPFSVDLHDISFEHVEAVLSLLNKKSGSIVQLPHSLRAVREFDTLVFCRYAENKSFNSEIYPEKEVFAEDYSLKFLLTANKKPSGYTDEIKFDYEKIISIDKLVIRNRADGDKIYLSGVGGRKSVKKILSELKMPLKERNEIIMLANDNDVLWINGLKTSGLYKADENTNKIMYLYVMNSEA